ncbi:hypothetical protein B0H17DRAFT_1152121 [Mycena rosella]|uniref:Ribonuclease H1 N-terminal domain-containing protein n=1 Tax=Mycena rosella TaxID=1033263 RepID=A0AAD7BFZ2_MYCRO|nr:hypothetical protein B0H17DRAFT_1152121 [Mycena rosella]
MSITLAHLGSVCAPLLFPANANTAAHDAEAGAFYYVVLVGRQPGIFLDLGHAKLQIENARNAKWQRFASYAGAIAFWNVNCREQHPHPRTYTVNGVGSFSSAAAAVQAMIDHYVTVV